MSLLSYLRVQSQGERVRILMHQSTATTDTLLCWNDASSTLEQWNLKQYKRFQYSLSSLIRNPWFGIRAPVPERPISANPELNILFHFL